MGDALRLVSYLMVSVQQEINSNRAASCPSTSSRQLSHSKYLCNLEVGGGCMSH